MVDLISRQPKHVAVNTHREPSFGAAIDPIKKTVKQSARQATDTAAPVPAENADAAKPVDVKASATPKPRESKKPAEKDEPAQLSFSAVRMLSHRYPGFITDTKDLRSKSESRYAIGIILFIVSCVLAAWVAWEQRYFHTDSDLVYYMGLTGGIMMLLTLLFALRKRIKFMKKLGTLSGWYYAHLVMGIVGPVLVILHSSFTMKALNSSVALVSMLLIITSGVIGRYIYTRIGYHVHKHLIEIRDTEQHLADSLQKFQGNAANDIEKTLGTLTSLVVNMPRSLLQMPKRFYDLRTKAAACYLTGIQHISLMLKRRAVNEGWDKHTYRAELNKEKLVLRAHVNALLQIGIFHFYERLLVGWRIFHVPLIFILVISGSVHVFAVHWY